MTLEQAQEALGKLMVKAAQTAIFNKKIIEEIEKLEDYIRTFPKEKVKEENNEQ